MLTSPVSDDSLLTELQAAIEARRVAEARVAELRQSLITRDLPRPWSFSHAGISGWVRDVPGQRGFADAHVTRAAVSEKLREAILALAWDRSAGPLDVQASASCAETGESIELSVHLPQTVPACLRDSGHEWAAVFLLEDLIEGHPRGRRVTEGCPHCDGQKQSLWPDTRCFPDAVVVTYQAPHHYPEGSIRRRLAEGAMP